MIVVTVTQDVAQVVVEDVGVEAADLEVILVEDEGRRGQDKHVNTFTRILSGCSRKEHDLTWSVLTLGISLVLESSSVCRLCA